MLSRASLPDAGWAFVAQDVTEKRHAERTAHRNEDRLRFALDAGGMGWWDWDADSGEVRWSENLARICGREPGTFGGTLEDFFEFVHPDDRERIRVLTEQGPKEEWQEIVYRGVWPDGTVRWYEEKGRNLQDADGRFRGMSGVTFDITERALQQERLASAEAQYRRLVEQLPLAVYRFAPEGGGPNAVGRVDYVSSQIESVLGYAPDEWAQEPGRFRRRAPPRRSRAGALGDRACSRDR